jgi:hypothetical protein
VSTHWHSSGPLIGARSVLVTFTGGYVSDLAAGYVETFGPGLLGGFGPLKRLLRFGFVCGVVGGALVGATLGSSSLAVGDHASSGLPGALLQVLPGVFLGVGLGALIGPLLAALVTCSALPLIVLFSSFREHVLESSWRHGRRIGRLLRRLERRLATRPVRIVNILERARRIEVLREDLLLRVFRSSENSLWGFTETITRLADDEYTRAGEYLDSAAGGAEADRILGHPDGENLVFVLGNHGPAQAGSTYSLAVRAALRRRVLAGSPHGHLLLVRAPWSFVECAARDGWVPVGDGVGPVSEEECETMVALWAEGSSEVYGDAAELLAAARRL